MAPHIEAMVKSLVVVAWADGRMDDDEKQVLEALIAAFDLSEEDSDTIVEYARTPRTLDDVPLSTLSAEDRRLLLQHAVVLTYVDGVQSEDEKLVLAALVKKLHLPVSQADALIKNAESRAKRLIALL